MTQVIINNNIQPNVNTGASYFDGGILELIVYSIGAFLLTAITFGLAYPWAMCMLFSWKTKHTVINGQRLKFVGSGASLFGNFIKWWFLCIITLGIYTFWVGIALEKWKVKNTTFA